MTNIHTVVETAKTIVIVKWWTTMRTEQMIHLRLLLKLIGLLLELGLSLNVVG
jgi:hypothetical protein